MIDRIKVNDHSWREDDDKMTHFGVIVNFLNHVAERSKEPSFILKGGTALMVCYGNERYSEDIDFDGIDPQPEKYIDSFCEDNGYWYRTSKNTNLVKRYLIHYNENKRPLEVEISYRERNIDLNDTVIKNGVCVYSIDALFNMKTIAYSHRDRIRDLYDIVFILKNYKNEVLSSSLKHFTRAIAYKGLEQFDYLIATQDNELIDKDRLASDFLEIYDNLGLISDREPEFEEEME